MFFLKLLIITVLFIAAGYFFGFIRIEIQTLFSEVRGEVLLDGKPLAGVEVLQQCADGKEWNRTVLTDDSGKFHFKKITRFSMYPNLWFFPESPIHLAQDIIINYEDSEYDAWLFSKDNYRNNTELDGKPFYLLCDLNNEPHYYGNAPKGRKPYGIFRTR